MKKKALSLFLVTAMAVSMVGCGSKDADKNTEKKDTEAAVETEKPAAAEDEAWEGDLTVWSPQEDQDTNWLQDQCEAFAAEHPNWKINFNYGVCAEGEAKDNVTKDVEAAADVYMLANDNIPDLVSAGALSELGGDYLGYVTSTNSDSILASVTYNDSVVAFPFTSNTWFMYYDKSVFSEDDVKNFDTMLEKAGEAGKKVSFKLTDSWYIQAFYVANGCTLFGDGTDTDAGIDFGGDKAAAVTEYLVDLAANPNFLVDADGSGLAGLGDSVAAVFSGTWDADAVKEKLGDNMGVAALPTVTIDGKEGQMKSFIGSKAIGVNPNAENQQVAMSLAAYLAGEKAQTAHYEMRNILPSNINISLADDPIATAVTNVMTDTSIMQPLCKEMGNYWSPAENMGKNIQSGEVTKDNAAEKTEEMNTTMNTDVAE
ncbi:sugar ABC transporter substrate-binding protein [Roseburia sp. AF15-21]|jgi:arabinogalactan oligomer / maltooligosaccharide transport system substrate-binding protein|uniref:extracellular solute-binding protein n=1 Tax=unclassified Roseburia TaxID=2637578 RepID=UPI000E4E8B84|nr:MULTISPECIES: extracellular solute-binding protein [unclassified Roseburia]RGF58436.1 sugar ABC transporter substrate-binding protein [Roseburia sp. AF34-16]RGI44503.1 sugar ABC transporter substrate-binding protein [Roseburia sp. OM04-10BH]RHR87168.1 sugar ABC transporter substrate-binding protein [Roseburia sp. AF15-21]RHV40659.1 sugar ABC transporter substrate-binding protein [Roseburia sp. OM04-15AA]RHV60610.1 sugar ABC transporter substrate-binding protein [Roseburia sp. OM04-10AA]